MARTQVYSGDCGYSATIDVVRLDGKHVQVIVHSECEQITAMNPDLTNIQWKGKGHQVFKGLSESIVYRSADKHIRHQGCPIPAAIIKTIEVEVGIALPKDVTIKFVHDQDDDYFDSPANK
jgi:hypothetical protein